MSTEDQIESIKRVLTAWANNDRTNSPEYLAAIMGILDLDPQYEDEEAELDSD